LTIKQKYEKLGHTVSLMIIFDKYRDAGLTVTAAILAIVVTAGNSGNKENQHENDY
jgi:hypothetical protein